MSTSSKPCPECRGRGWVDSPGAPDLAADECRSCRGTGALAAGRLAPGRDPGAVADHASRGWASTGFPPAPFGSGERKKR